MRLEWQWWTRPWANLMLPLAVTRLMNCNTSQVYTWANLPIPSGSFFRENNIFSITCRHDKVWILFMLTLISKLLKISAIASFFNTLLGEYLWQRTLSRSLFLNQLVEIKTKMRDFPPLFLIWKSTPFATSGL